MGIKKNTIEFHEYQWILQEEFHTIDLLSIQIDKYEIEQKGFSFKEKKAKQFLWTFIFVDATFVAPSLKLVEVEARMCCIKITSPTLPNLWRNLPFQ